MLLYLMNVNGVITGDFLLQMHQKALKEDAIEDSSQLPTLGSPEYINASPALSITHFAALGDSEDAKELPEPEGFVVFTQEF